ncbi:putative mitochondrial carrier protein [Helianthus anomalus]
MEAQVGMSSHGGVVDGGTAVKFLQKQQPSPRHHHHKQSAEIGTVHQLLAGGIAGAFSKTCTAPLARLTILFQVQGMHAEGALLSRPCIWNEALRIVNEEGVRAFWKGNMVTIAHRLPYTAVNFYAYEQYKKVAAKVNTEYRKQQWNCSCRCMFALCRRWNVRNNSCYRNISFRSHQDTACSTGRSTIYYNGISHAFRTICRDEGVLGLYKGLGPTLLGVGPSIAISFSVYETLRTYWKSHRPNDSTVMVSLACGSLSGIASSTATFPLDLVRRRKQLEGVGGRARVYNSGLLGTLGQIIRTEGLRGLYRGILPEYYKVVPGVGIVFMTYETLKKLLSEPPSF